MIKKLQDYICKKLLDNSITSFKVSTIVNEYKNRITLKIFIPFKDYSDKNEVKESTKNVIKEVKKLVKEVLSIDKSPTSAAYGKARWQWKGREILMYYDLDKETIDSLIALACIEKG